MGLLTINQTCGFGKYMKSMNCKCMVKMYIIFKTKHFVG